jgi:hypothetical protein
MRIVRHFAACALLASASLAQQANLATRCGFPEANRWGPPASLRPPGDCAYASTRIKPRYAPENGIVYEIPVVFHLITDTRYRGWVSKKRVLQQLQVVNEDFRALAGTPGEHGVDVRFQFYLARFDPDGNPTEGITRTANDLWFADLGTYYKQLSWDSNRYVNIFVNMPQDGVFGYVEDFPQKPTIVGSARDRIVLLHSTVGRPAPFGPPYDQGRTLTHELGHYFALDHTFYRGCGSGSCYSSGDNICDTNPESRLALGCPVNRKTCNSPDPIRNYMNYSDDLCMTEFTPEQANRMRCTIENWRPDLYRSICATTATASAWNVGSNPFLLTASPPIVGDDLTIDLDMQPGSLAFVMCYARKASLPYPGGQMLLVDLSSTQYFTALFFGGPAAQMRRRVPHDVNLCGATSTIQAVVMEPEQPFALTNAVDLTVGGAR